MRDLSQCYRVLGLKPGASLSEVNRAYRALATQWHPDRFPLDNLQLQSEAQEKLKELNHARDQLRLHRFANHRQASPERGKREASSTAKSTSATAAASRTAAVHPDQGGSKRLHTEHDSQAAPRTRSSSAVHSSGIANPQANAQSTQSAQQRIEIKAPGNSHAQDHATSGHSPPRLPEIPPPIARPYPYGQREKKTTVEEQRSAGQASVSQTSPGQTTAPSVVRPVTPASPQAAAVARNLHPDWSGMDLSQANLRERDLSGRNLSQANLSRANLSDTFMHKINLSGATLYQANLYRANLLQANLQGANLREANLIGADFSGANLTGADLSGARVSIADRWMVKLTGATLTGAIMPDGSIHQ